MNKKVNSLLLIFFPFFISAQSKFSATVGLNNFNQFTDIQAGGFYGGQGVLATFYFAPMIGVNYDFNEKHRIRYSKSILYRFAREPRPNLRAVIEIRTLDRLSYMYSFKSKTFLTGGFTYLLGKSEASFPLLPLPRETYGDIGFHIGIGKHLRNGYFEFSNLLAFEYSELTPADLFGFWVFDLGYDIKSRKEQCEEDRSAFNVFGFAFNGSIAGFNNRSQFPVHPLLEYNFGFELFHGIKRWNTTIFWRKNIGLHIYPVANQDIAFQTRFNYLGIRQQFNFRSLNLYGTASYLSGVDAKYTIGDIYGMNGNSIQGFNLGLGYNFNNRWSIELVSDCYLKTPYTSVAKGFAWDRIRLSAIYYLPISTK